MILTNARRCAASYFSRRPSAPRDGACRGLRQGRIIALCRFQNKIGRNMQRLVQLLGEAHGHAGFAVEQVTEAAGGNAQQLGHLLAVVLAVEHLDFQPANQCIGPHRAVAGPNFIIINGFGQGRNGRVALGSRGNEPLQLQQRSLVFGGGANGYSREI